MLFQRCRATGPIAGQSLLLLALALAGFGAGLFSTVRVSASEAELAALQAPEVGIPPVPELPPLTEVVLPAPDPAALERLDQLLRQLNAPEPGLREQARRRVLEVDSSWLPAIAERLDRLAESADRSALAALLEKLRRQTHDRLKAERGVDGTTALAALSDTFEMVVAHPDRSPADLRPLSDLIALSRMLERLGSAASARRIIVVYERFGELVRNDTQRALARMHDAALPALIEATGHPLRRIASWAERQLADMGKSLPNDALQVADPALRADILRAYGKARNRDAARLVIAYASNERPSLRRAAREAVTLLGGAALWPLREAYEKALAEPAPAQWAWDRLARELFAHFDRQRQAALYELFNQGRQAASRGDLDAARAFFDRVLTADPVFERGALMAPVYLAFAEQHADSDAAAARLALLRVERLQPSGPVAARALSLRDTLEARLLLARGIADELLVHRARDLDPDNQRARRLSAELALGSEQPPTHFGRFLAAGVIALLALLALLGMALRERRAERTRATEANI
jgi:hypothetical protein